MVKTYGLPKSARVHGRDDVNILFKEGKGFFSFPFKCVYVIREDISDEIADGRPLRMMVSVGKRYHKRAVRRNRVKRLAREAFRLNKPQGLEHLTEKIGSKIVDICYIYTSPKEEDFNTVEHGIKKSFEKLAALL